MSGHAADDTACMLCGRTAQSHHEFTKRLPGCVCPDWETADEYLPICAEFKSGGPGVGFCDDCEHDEGCHAPKTEATATKEGP